MPNHFITGAKVLARHYSLRDQNGRAIPGGSFLEQNAVVSGTGSAKNAVFFGDDWDYISAGNQDG